MCFNNRYFPACSSILYIVVLLCMFAPVRAQTFKYKSTEASEIVSGSSLNTHGLPDTLTVWCNDWDFITANPTSWGNTIKLKSNNTFVKFGVDNFYPITAYLGSINYTYRLTYEIYGFNDPTDTIAGYVHSSDTLTISYAYNSTSNPYQDLHLKKYSQFYKAIIIVTGVYDDAGGVITPATLSNVLQQNFFVEGSIVTQRYDKAEYGTGGTPLVTMPFANPANNYLTLFWNYTSGDTSAIQLTPVNYQLEWTYVDNYSRNVSTGAITSLSPAAVNYTFNNNSTRVWLDSNFYRIPLVYQNGYVVFRVRTVRPDSNLFQYPVYGDWSLPDSGLISTTSSDAYYEVTTPYANDSLNWQYTVSFAEGGKHKQVTSFFDGMLKHRQSITRLNSNPDKLIVTQNVYDFEGRPAIKTIPTPVSASSFKYQPNVDINSVTNNPYKAGDFDTGYALCPSRPVISPLADNALASVYYSNQNPDTVGFQKFVPDAEGYPLVQTIFSPGYNSRVEQQGGAGQTLQIGNDHTLINAYVGANQASLNTLFGLNVGWQSYYNMTVGRDQNKQYSMSVKDYEGKQVVTAMIGPGPNPADHAMVSVDAPPSFTLREDLLFERPQMIIDNTKIADYDFFNQANGMDSLQYIYSYAPFPICPGQSLSVRAHFQYDVTDQCGVVVASEDSTIGVNGIVSGTTSFSGAVSTFYATVAPYHVHKEMTIDPYDMSAALDSFFNAPPSCFHSEPYFIRTAVEARTFPCPGEKTPCEKKKWEMMQELFPMAKYGKYTKTGTLVNNTPNSIFTRFSIPGDPYRYQDTCTIPSLSDTILVGGVLYTNLRTMRADSFIKIYDRAIDEGNYSIAESLLPLHPEYCQLKDCFNDTFKTLTMAIPDAKVAERLNRLYLDSIVAHDPVVPLMVAASYTSAADSLKTFIGGTRRLDSITLINAYCGCSDSVMFAQCANEMFNHEITNRLLVNDKIKSYYFDNILELYFNNRERFINAISMGRGDSCSHCAIMRMTLIPEPVFDMSISAVGAIEMDSFSTYSTFSGGGSMGWFPTMTVADSLDSTLVAVYDSALALYNYTDSILCYGQIDSIVARLGNCIQGSPALDAAIRNTLDSLCDAHVIVNGNYKPEHIRFALTRNSVSMNDICNPYLISYTYFPAQEPPNQNCKPDTFYRALNTFLTDTAIVHAFGTPGSLHNYTLNTSGNIFEAAVAVPIGTSAAQAFAGYDTSNKVLSLFLYDPTGSTDTVKLFLRTPVFGNVFSFTTDSFVVKASCINMLPQPMTEGLVNEYTFFTEVTRYATSAYFTSTMLGWVDTIPTMLPDTNPLAKCIPCTQMKNLYEQFKDTLQLYGVAGADHPYYGQMLRSYMNYNIRQSFTTDQYETFIESCALADSMHIPLYAAYATYLFTDSAGMSAFIDTLNMVDTNYDFSTSYREDSAGFVRVCVNLNSVPEYLLWKYKQKLNSYGGAYVGRIVNTPLRAWQPANSLGYLYTSPAYPFNPCDSVLFVPSDSITCTSHTRKVWVTDHFETKTFYDITCVSLTPHYRSQECISKLTRYIFDHEIPDAVFVPNYMHTVDEDYYKPEKKDYLQYTYSLQNRQPYEVLDSIREHYLITNIPSYSTYNVSYTTPFNLNIFNNLYVANSSVANRLFDTLKYVMNTVETSNPISTGDIFFDSNQVHIPVTGSRSLIAYWCADGTYWYRYFGGGDTLYNLFVYFPAYVPKYLHKQYHIMTSGIVPDLGDSTTRFFTLHLKRPGDTAEIRATGLATFTIGNNMVLENVLMGQPITGTGASSSADTFDICERDVLDGAIEEGVITYNHYIDSIKTHITGAFRKYMMDSVHEQLILSYLNNEFAYTLYHYDRAGNLVSTVPPMGVQKLPIWSVTDVNNDRKNNMPPSIANVPVPSKANTYEYNSVNQVLKQTTINGGSTTFEYDKAGRLMLSQNAKQAISGDYTYNVYDRQNRIIETGQANIFATYMLGLTADSMRDYIRTLDRRDVVMTVYDTQIVGLDTIGYTLQQNLRKRVAAVMYFDTLYQTDTFFKLYTYATHYSYDIAGNVQTLTHDFPALGEIKQRYKRIDYDYDLLSGKVNMLSYNRGFPDQYYQRYSYDADNRIEIVETSSEGYIWKKDATYSYYQHGPLARIDLGDLRVQGIDYAYTLQGWLKAANGDTLNPGMDMGQDGTPSGPINASDAVAYTIDYFDGDYQPIGTWGMQHTPAVVRNLYNGNIAQQTMAIDSFQRLNKQYVYDQLNRLKSADYAAIDAATNTLTGLNDYKSRYCYDMDGNLNTLVRYGNDAGSGATVMDSLTYRYMPGVGNDKLRNVVDSAANTYTNDIPNFTTVAAMQYAYDATGNTIRDLVNAQDTIEWNLYNKVKRSVNNADSSELRFMYDGMGNRVAKSYSKSSSLGRVTHNDYFVHDAAGNVLAIYHGIDAYTPTDSIAARDYSLAQHDIYGTSRLGVKNYYPQQVGGSWDYLTPTCDTSRLAVRLPWYSREYDDNITWFTMSPYGNTFTDSQYAQHVTGQKQYEFTDHLGNVLATISDQRTGGTFTTATTPTSILTYTPFVVSKYDYYPFGQMMPGRYVDDTGVKCVTTTITAVVPVYDTIVHAHYVYDTTDSVRRFYFNSSCSPCGLLPRLDSVVFSASHATIYATHSSVWVGAPTFVLTGLNPCNIDTVKTYISNVSYFASYPGPLYFGSVYDSGWSGSYSGGGAGITLGPPVPSPIVVPYPFVHTNYFGDTISPVTWSISPMVGTIPPTTYWSSYQLDSIVVTQNPYCATYVPDSIVTHMEPMSVVATVCSENKYEYGYNGQMKVNEIAGVGNHNTALYWEYDTRTGRRWNLDPIPKYGISIYSAFNDNPILYSDVLGDDTGRVIISEKIWKNVYKTHLDGIKKNPQLVSPNGKIYLSYDPNRSNARKRRREARGNNPTIPEQNLDEFPYASTRQGGRNAAVNYVPESENKEHGGYIGSVVLRDKMRDGDLFEITLIPDNDEKKKVPQLNPLIVPSFKPRPYMGYPGQGVGDLISKGIEYLTGKRIWIPDPVIAPVPAPIPAPIPAP